MVVEVGPQSGAQRLASALVAAEARDPHAWRLLDEAALFQLRSAGLTLVTLVPWAVLGLAEQLARHPNSSVRLDAVRLLGLLQRAHGARAEAALRLLIGDGSRGVRRAAAEAMRRQGL
jgi:hypothetical protein